MADLSDYLEHAFIDHLFNKATLGQITGNIYVALFTTAPTDAVGSGTEVSGTGYARAATATDDWARSGSTIDNELDIDFAEAGGSWGNVKAVALFDALTGDDNMLCWKTLSSPKDVNTGDTARFKDGDLDFTLD